MNPRSKSGFTLIELSIVLVIIGLIVGGVMTGKYLIEVSHIRREASQLQEYITATNTFRAKYNCSPGDCSNATSLFSGAVNGNGNGRVESFWIGDSESAQFWQQLSQANLIAGTYRATSWTDAPTGILSGTARYMAVYFPTTIWATNGSEPGLNMYEIWSPPMNFSGSSNVIVVADLNCGGPKGGFNSLQAFAIDTKLDDGMPGTGKIVQFVPWTGGGSCIQWGGCVTSMTRSSAQYTMDATPNNCSILYQNAF